MGLMRKPVFAMGRRGRLDDTLLTRIPTDVLLPAGPGGRINGDCGSGKSWAGGRVGGIVVAVARGVGCGGRATFAEFDVRVGGGGGVVGDVFFGDGDGDWGFVFGGFEADYFGEGDEPRGTVVDEGRDVDLFPLQTLECPEGAGRGDEVPGLYRGVFDRFVGRRGRDSRL